MPTKSQSPLSPRDVMPQIVEIRTADDPRDVIHRACQILAEGGLVAFPTEAAYVVTASALSEQGMKRLAALRSRELESSTEQPHALHPHTDEGEHPSLVLLLKEPYELHDYVINLPAHADKLSRRAWPGPLTMRFPSSSLGGLFQNLPEITRNLLQIAPSAVAFRVAAHEALMHVQRMLPSPLAATADYGMSRPLPGTAQDIVARFGDAVSLIIDDGRCRYCEPTTTIQWSGNRWTLLEQGVISALNLERLMSEIYLFVCTGNTCRSPMAEGLFRSLLLKQLDCDEDELMDRGYAVISAGLAARSGGPASNEAIAVMADSGIDIRSHESQPVTPRLLNHADHILTMTRGHQMAILSEYPELADRVRMLSADRRDVSDPFGGDRCEYQACKEEIEGHIRKLLDQIPKQK